MTKLAFHLTHSFSAHALATAPARWRNVVYALSLTQVIETSCGIHTGGAWLAAMCIATVSPMLLPAQLVPHIMGQALHDVAQAMEQLAHPAAITCLRRGQHGSIDVCSYSVLLSLPAESKM